MAPALTKTLKNVHGIHLSSPPASVRMDSDGRTMCTVEQELHLRSMDEDDHQKEPLSSSGSLVNLLSFSEDQRDSHQVASVFPGVPDMFLFPAPENNSQEARLLYGQSAAPECRPDGGDVHPSSFILTSVCPSYSQRGITPESSTPLFTTEPTMTQEKVSDLASVQPCTGTLNLEQLASRGVLLEAVKEQVSRQTELHSQAWRLQKRLQALLGEHALLHCSQQLEGLKKHCQLGEVSLYSLDSGYCCEPPPLAGDKPNNSWLESSAASSLLTEVGEFSRSSQVVLKQLQEALDSDATASSSSDDEPEDNKSESANVSPNSSSSRCERQWLMERAELSSRWSWLQLRLAKLEEGIQQLAEVHKHMRSNKVGVVLAESQPLTDRKIQHNLLRDIAGLSCTASDADTEPCSPTRLLYNIERQSAQLSQFVNSLMPPLSFSPPSKPQKGRRTLTRKGEIGYMTGNSKRGILRTGRPFKADTSCVCARTRPLVSCHKPKLFAVNFCNPGSPVDVGSSLSTSSSSLLSSCCSPFSSCDPVVLCHDPDCSSSSSFRSKHHSSASSTFDTPMSHHLQKVGAREEWCQRPLVINSQPCHRGSYRRCSSTPLHNGHKYKEYTWHHKNRVMGLSPIRLSGIAQSQHNRGNQRKRRRHIHRLTEDEEDVLYQLCDPEESSDDVLEETYTCVSRKQASQGFVRKRQGESVYNINNILIPISLAKVEKLQYKDITTPNWRVVDTKSQTETEAKNLEKENEEKQVEDLSDEVFTQRHLALEQREKLHLPYWGRRKCGRRPTRSGSRLLGSGGGKYTSGEESSVEWSRTQLDTDEQPKSEEWLPQTPWEPRVFPLDEDEEVALFSDKLETTGWPESGSACFSTSKNSTCYHCPAQAACATLPSHGQSKSSTPTGS
ncbi:KAT8 regulatory NSL complex subunit 1-like protein isoform X2 [Parambassis ranga]|uniref:KAT8 regulatory NSL complex subunit 1-like protein isoform X2 n=1 Tax=Parambassis ranga TaxID=210632 RepID=A0A6P7HFF6_9TELE|nr:KAT8 regulatory NSL complex subunit 1-like protein isoform X2 [Parambassis ranga]